LTNFEKTHKKKTQKKKKKKKKKIGHPALIPLISPQPHAQRISPLRVPHCSTGEFAVW
jgi:hypothetical protein